MSSNDYGDDDDERSEHTLTNLVRIKHIRSLIHNNTEEFLSISSWWYFMSEKITVSYNHARARMPSFGM